MRIGNQPKDGSTGSLISGQWYLLPICILLWTCGGCASNRHERIREQLTWITEANQHEICNVHATSTGSLISQVELDDIASRLRTMVATGDPVELTVVCYGWNTRPAEADAFYVDFAAGLLKRSMIARDRPPRAPSRQLFVGVAWDSALTVTTDTLDKVLPAPLLATTIGAIPDALAFPLTFWSRASAADRVGYLGIASLLRSLGRAGVLDSGVSIHLIGHSFGGRAVAQACLALRNDPVEVHIADAILVQPAMPEMLVPDGSGRYVVVVTYNTYDKANKMLFPAANFVVPTFWFSKVEEGEADEWGSEAFSLFTSTALSPALWAAWGAVDFALILIAGTTLPSLDSDGRAFSNITPAATASELPLVGDAVRKVGAKASGDAAWGRRSAPVFSGGWWLQSAGASPLSGSGVGRVVSYPEFMESKPCTGVYRVDLSSVVYRSSILGYDMRAWWAQLFSWIDPIGTHSCLGDSAVLDLIIHSQLRLVPSQ